MLLVYKIILGLSVLVFPVMFPTNFPETATIQQRLTTGDTDEYLAIAAHGYIRGTRRCAFYPLWPACIKIGSIFTGNNPLVAAYLIVNIFSMAAFLALHTLILKQHGLSIADNTVLLLMAYPGSIFFNFPYSEALFLLLLVKCLLFLRHERFMGAAITAYLMPLTRPIGIVILPVLMWELVDRKSPAKRYLLCLAPALGQLTYFGVMYAFTGNAFEGFKAQERFPAHASIDHMFDLGAFIRSLSEFEWAHTMLYSFIDRIAFLLFLISCYWIIRINVGYYIYSIQAGMIPALALSMVSYTRYSSLVFPMFLVWGIFTTRTKTIMLVLFFLFCIQCAFLVWHISGRWAG